MNEDRLLDLRGMRCPWPALRVARALREGPGRVVAIADDPAAPGEIAAVARVRGWRASAIAHPLGAAIALVADAHAAGAPR